MKNKSVNLLEEWVDFLPQKIIDARKSLPTHKTMRWKRRNISDIKGLCTHQTLGGDNPEATAKYHIKYFNNGKGAPGICYTFYVRKSGEIWWCNDIEDVVLLTWAPDR